jgi:hypothetical protein
LNTRINEKSLIVGLDQRVSGSYVAHAAQCFAFDFAVVVDDGFNGDAAPAKAP